MSDILNSGSEPCLSNTGYCPACPDCKGTGLRDSGVLPWGEAALVPCDCGTQGLQELQQAAESLTAPHRGPETPRHTLVAEAPAEAARAVTARAVGNYSPAEQRAFNAGRAFAERVARAEQNARSLAVTKIALDGLGDDFSPWDALQEIVKMLYPDLADLVDQDPALARRALNALQPD